jgi:hypothetical protein
MREKRATTSAALYPAIPRLAGDIAASRAEEPGSCSQKIHKVNFL